MLSHITCILIQYEVFPTFSHISFLTCIQLQIVYCFSCTGFFLKSLFYTLSHNVIKMGKVHSSHIHNILGNQFVHSYISTTTCHFALFSLPGLVVRRLVFPSVSVVPRDDRCCCWAICCSIWSMAAGATFMRSRSIRIL